MTISVPSTMEVPVKDIPTESAVLTLEKLAIDRLKATSEPVSALPSSKWLHQNFCRCASRQAV